MRIDSGKTTILVSMNADIDRDGFLRMVCREIKRRRWSSERAERTLTFKYSTVESLKTNGTALEAKGADSSAYLAAAEQWSDEGLWDVWFLPGGFSITFIPMEVIEQSSGDPARLQSSGSGKIQICLSADKGIFRYVSGKPYRYPHINGRSKIFATVDYLRENGATAPVRLAAQMHQTARAVKSNIDRFNMTAKSRLKLSPRWPIITGENIYELDIEHYEFVVRD